jgi:hypothetical protein
LRSLPALVIEAAQQHRQLRTEMVRIGGSDAIAQGMQHRPQCRIGSMAIIGTDPLHQVLEPEITLLDCRIEHVEARRHGITRWGVLEAQPRVDGNDGIDLAQEAARESMLSH